MGFSTILKSSPGLFRSLLVIAFEIGLWSSVCFTPEKYNLRRIFDGICIFGLSGITVILWVRQYYRHRSNKEELVSKQEKQQNDIVLEEDSPSVEEANEGVSTNLDEANAVTSDNEQLERSINLKQDKQQIDAVIEEDYSPVEEANEGVGTNLDEANAVNSEDEQVDSSNNQHPLVRKYLSKRLPYLDVIKVILIVAVVFAHCSQSAGSVSVTAWSPKIADYTNWLSITGAIVAGPAVATLMNLFFFISGIFTPRSFKSSRTTEEFVFRKLKRLILPTLISYVGLGPLNNYIAYLTTGADYVYTFQRTILWFIIILTWFNLAYAFVMAATAGAGDLAIRSWFGQFFKFDATLYLWIMAAGVFNGLVNWADPALDERKIFGAKMFPGNAFPLWNVYFFAGCFAGDNGWCDYFEKAIAWTPADSGNRENDEEEQTNQERTNAATNNARNLIYCAYYTLPITVIPASGYLVYLSGTYDGFGWPLVESICEDVLLAIMSLSLIIIILDYTCNKVKTINLTMLMMMQAAYAVYLIHPIVVTCVTSLWVYILRNGFGIDIVFQTPLVSSTVLSGGMILFGWIFIVLLTELISWPLSFFVRKLPVLNQMI
mgnify:CR=1 FL=1